MNIAIIGAGNLGSALARGWLARGHAVTMAVRDPHATDAVKGGTPSGAAVATSRDAVANADVVIVATPARAMTDVLSPLVDLLKGKIVVDATNPVGPGIQLVTGVDGASQAEAMQALLPDARVIKSFNQTGANNIPAVAGTPRPVMFVAGDDASACTIVARLADDLGFESVHAGALVRSRELERLAILWISLSASAATGLGRGFAFALVRS